MWGTPAWIRCSVWRKLSWASPGFPAEFGGVGKLHAAFLIKSRTRGRVLCSVQEIRVARLFRPRYALARGTRPFSKGFCFEQRLRRDSRQGGQGVLDRGGLAGRNGVAPEAVEF